MVYTVVLVAHYLFVCVVKTTLFMQTYNIMFAWLPLLVCLSITDFVSTFPDRVSIDSYCIITVVY